LGEADGRDDGEDDNEYESHDSFAFRVMETMKQAVVVDQYTEAVGKERNTQEQGLPSTGVTAKA
jgi:hypothetical protein